MGVREGVPSDGTSRMGPFDGSFFDDCRIPTGSNPPRVFLTPPTSVESLTPEDPLGPPEPTRETENTKVVGTCVGSVGPKNE